jgi:hypothetical protein
MASGSHAEIVAISRACRATQQFAHLQPAEDADSCWVLTTTVRGWNSGPSRDRLPPGVRLGSLVRCGNSRLGCARWNGHSAARHRAETGDVHGRCRRDEEALRSRRAARRANLAGNGALSRRRKSKRRCEPAQLRSGSRPGVACPRGEPMFNLLGRVDGLRPGNGEALVELSSPSRSLKTLWSRLHPGMLTSRFRRSTL